MVDAEQIATLLNEAYKLDPAAMTLLFCARRACNDALANHPHIQVHGKTEKGPFTVGFIGLINGILLSAGSEKLVTVMYDDADNQNVVGFSVVTKPEVGL